MKKALILVLALLFGAKAYPQEWVYSDLSAASDTVGFSTADAIELSNGMIAASTVKYFCSGYGDFYTPHPSLTLFTPKGDMAARKSFFRPGYWGSTTPFFFENGQGELLALMSFSPDHDSTYFNYFRNYDDPPADAIIALYRLDNMLNILEAHEHRFAIDTFENKNNQFWNWMPQEHSGNIFIFSAFADGDAIVGAYAKTSTYCPAAPRDRDSIFFFRMDFAGNFIDRVGYETVKSGMAYHLAYRRQHMVKVDGGYHLFVQGSGGIVGFGPTVSRQGTVFYLDDNLNILKHKQFKHYNYLPPNGANNSFYNISAKRSHRGTTYIATSAKSKTDPSHDEDCRLYEYDDSFDASNPIPIVNYTERYTTEWDTPAHLRAVDVAADGSVYFAYTLNVGYENDLDSWIMIERLDPDLDTLTTVYYDLMGEDDRFHSEAKSIVTTSDGGLLLVFSSYDLDNASSYMYSVAKFSGNAFVGIDEAHANGLKVAVAYPNPGNGSLNIRTGLRNASVEVFDATGRLMHRQDATHDITAIGTEAWPSGIYLWKVYANGTVAETGKWVKE